METQLTRKQVKEIIIRELPEFFKKDKEIQKYILEITKGKYADKEKTEDRIDRVLNELKQDREKSEKRWEAWERKWEKFQQEDQKKWDAQEEKWKENQKVISEILYDIRKQDKRYELTIGALGARWGLHSEAAFRNGLKAILEKSFGVKVENYLDFDEEGMIFGRPDQVELDVIIHNGLTILCEIKSSMSKP